MQARFRQAFLPRLEPEQRAFRRRVAQTLLRSALVILTIWLIAEVVFLLASPTPGRWTPAYDAIAIALLLATVALGFRWLKKDRHLAVGYLLATAAFAYPLVNALLAPGDILLVNPAMLISILIAGTIVGPAAGYLFAVASILVNLVTWFNAQGVLLPGAAPPDASTGLIFLLVQGLTALTAAVVLDALMNHINETIRRLHEQAQQLAELAHSDPLTGLANRRWFVDQLEREFARARRHARPLSLIYMDLDGFKMINDRFGHLFGDDVLRGVSRSMMAVLRSTDLLARIGGDEFAVILPETGESGAINVSQKLRKALAAYAGQYGAGLPPLTFCAGIAQLRHEDATVDDMLARADGAQYLAKATGKDHTRTQSELAGSTSPSLPA
jgi:diguanylate cyclase (GGDEF)-like protein